MPFWCFLEYSAKCLHEVPCHGESSRYLPRDRDRCRIQECWRTRPTTTILLALGLFPVDYLLKSRCSERKSKILIPTEHVNDLFYSFSFSQEL